MNDLVFHKDQLIAVDPVADELNPNDRVVNSDDTGVKRDDTGVK